MKSKAKKYKDINSSLIEASRKGDQKAQFELYKRYYRAMYNTCLRIVKNEQEAEDIMQEAFLKAFSNLDKFSEQVSFGAWLKKIVVNQALDQLRKKKMFFEPLSEIEIQDENAEEDSGSLIATEDVNKIKKAIEALPSGYQLVLNLYLFEGYDHEEIGEIPGITPSTSRSQFMRAKKKLAANLKIEK